MKLRSVIVASLLAVLSFGCENKQTDAPATAKQEATEAKPPAEKTRITLGFGPTEKPADRKADAEKVAQFLAEKTGYQVDVSIPESTGEAIRALRKNKVQVAHFDAWPYLAAHYAADADLLLAEERGGKTATVARWYVATDSKIDAPEKLRGEKLAFTAPTSVGGFLLPYAHLIKSGVVKKGETLEKAFDQVTFAGTDAAALGAVLSGTVDAAAADAAAFDALAAETQAKLKPLGEMEMAVPTSGFAVRADMKLEVREKLKAAMLELNEKPELLRSGFGVEKLVARTHGEHVFALQEAQDTVGVSYPLAPTDPAAIPAGGAEKPEEAGEPATD